MIGVKFTRQYFLHLSNLQRWQVSRIDKQDVEINIREIAERISRIYKVNANELLKKKSKYADARNMVIELAYLGNMHTKSLSDIGKELGGISGSAVGYVHSRIQRKLKENKAIKKIFIEAGKALSILET
ncbi:MAG: hypothetical protein ABII23_01815 [bacterium]